MSYIIHPMTHWFLCWAVHISPALQGSSCRLGLISWWSGHSVQVWPASVGLSHDCIGKSFTAYRQNEIDIEFGIRWLDLSNNSCNARLKCNIYTDSVKTTKFIWPGTFGLRIKISAFLATSWKKYKGMVRFPPLNL